MATTRTKKLSKSDISEAEHYEILLQRFDKLEELFKGLKEDNKLLVTRVDEISSDTKTIIGRLQKVEDDNKALNHKIRNLEKENQTRTEEMEYMLQRNNYLEDKVNELEQYSKLDNIVISGMKMLRPFNKTVQEQQPTVDTAENEIVVVEEESKETEKWSNRDKGIMVTNIAKFMKDKLDIEIQKTDVVDIHTLKHRDSHSKGTCIVRFSNRIIRESILRSKKKLNGTGVFISEHLTKENSYLYKLARDLRRRNKIQKTWTVNCRIFAKMNNNNIKEIKDRSFFDEFM